MWKIVSTLIVLILIVFVCQSSAATNSHLPRLDLIKGSGPEVFILEKGTRHWIPDIETFNRFRFKWENIKIYADSVLENYPRDDDWSSHDDYPDGSLLKGSSDKVYLIELGQRRWIPSPAIFTGNDFGWKYILEVDDDVIDDYDLGSNLTLNESDRYPNTIIIDGPSQGEILDTALFEFRYSGTNPLGVVSDLDFETYLRGYDTSWRNQGSSYTEEYDLSDQVGQNYTFYVRAKNEQGYYDPTPASRTFQLGVSSNYQKVEIRNIEYNQTDFKEDYIVLRNVSDENINITSWTIRTNNASVDIPQAVKVLSFPFTSADKVDIVLAPNDELVAMSGNSPSGVNFLTNKCTDYLDQGEYSPSLDNNNCPWPSSSDYSYLNEYCRDFINDLDRCETADYSSNTDVGGNSQCTSYLNDTFNYSACYYSYRLDPDFYEDEWRIFFNRTSRDVFSNVSDTVILEDANGLKVDEYYYD
ncbi:hypothetical protein KKE13_03285 [Patescibacteria group bacterium]|nr:hypothetical protein [Patescibacteria group bacterium]